MPRKKLRGAPRPKPKTKKKSKKPKGLARLRSLDPRWMYAALVLAAALLLFGSSGFRRLVSSTLLLRRMEAEGPVLEREMDRLERDIRKAKTDDRALENELRKMGFIGPNEIEYRFTPPKKGSE